MAFIPSEDRYKTMPYNRCGKSGLKLPAISLGLWHNFGGVTLYENSRNMVRKAFDLGVTHFDIANNYGPPPGSAEESYGRILKSDFHGYRDEMVISTKAGYYMWPGPYGEWGSKKSLMASLDQSLQRLGLDYVDIFYHHRPDPETPLEETMRALDLMVRQGKALYVGISNYNAQQAKQAVTILKSLGTPCLIHQARYSMLDRWVENGLLDVLEEEGVGCIAFSPLAKGLLTDRYINGIPADSRAAGSSVFLKPDNITPQVMEKVVKLNDLAGKRGQSLAQMALSWLLKDKRVTSVLIGASKPEQVEDCVKAAHSADFSQEELQIIEDILRK
ncbi:MAG TPA: L-glyceraldehyde 3-phosphate reductase [Clostridiales bacterium]|nr:L-glyceraldehyde 3-phosphate reductase [Clostridiales bacterium]